jgi:hypothetical protein
MRRQREATLRPCDGNCGYLDPATDGCHRTLRVSDDVKAKVAFTVGKPCRVAVT